MRHVRNIFYIILLSIGFVLLVLTINVVIIFAIDVIFYNKIAVPKFNWDDIFGMALPTLLIFLIYIKQIRKNRSLGNTNAIIIWSVSFLMVGFVCLFSLGSMAYKSTRKYVNENKDFKITNLSDLVKHSGKLAGKSISLSDKRIDSASLMNDVNRRLDSVKPKWQNIVSEKGGFSILFPDLKVKEDTITELVDSKKVPIHLLSVNAQGKADSNLGYSVSFFSLSKNQATNEFFDREKRSLLSKVNGTLEYENIVDSFGYPCRDLYITIDQKDLKATCRLFYSRNHFFVLLVLTQDGNLFNKSIYHFIDSFQFLK